MDAIPQRVLKLVLEDDTCPIDDWLDSLRDTTTRARGMRRIDRLTRGNFGDYKGVDHDVSELRLDFGPGYRVYYGRIDNTVVVLLGGSDKSKQSAGIKTAQRLWDEFKQLALTTHALLEWDQTQHDETREPASEADLPSDSVEGTKP